MASPFARLYARVPWARDVVGIGRFGLLLYAVTQTFEITMTVGPSMLPTLNATGDIVFVDKLSHRLERLKIGDVVIAQLPDDWGKTVCKRVVGLEGDRVLDGHGREKRVPEGTVWLEGDNADDSRDSRAYGPVKTESVRGRVAFRLWPLTHFGFIDDPTRSSRRRL